MSINNFISGFDKAMAFSFYALIYFLPISIALSEIFTVAALVFYLIKRTLLFCQNADQRPKTNLLGGMAGFIKAFKPVKSFLNWPIALFLVANLISVVLSQYHKVGIEGFLGKSLQSAFLYFTFIECINSKKRLNIFLTALFVSVLLVCVNGFYQYFTGEGFTRGNIITDGRISSSFRAHNDFAGYLITIAPILLCLSVVMTLIKFNNKTPITYQSSDFSFYQRKTGRLIIFTLFLLVMICFGLTFSRGAWVSFVLVLMFMGIHGKKSALVSVLVFCLFFSVFSPLLYQSRRVGIISDTVAETVQDKIERLTEEENIANRLRRSIGEAGTNKDEEFRIVKKKKIPDIALDFGESDFTIDFWINFIDLSGNQGMIHQSRKGDELNNYWDFFKHAASNKIMFDWVADGVNRGHFIVRQDRLDLKENVWAHIAFVRKKSKALLFVDGKSVPLKTLTKFGDLKNIGGPLHIGRASKINDSVKGYIDNFRITKDKALWNQNFTPPTHLHGVNRKYSINDSPLMHSRRKMLSVGSGSQNANGSLNSENSVDAISQSHKRSPEVLTITSEPIFSFEELEESIKTKISDAKYVWQRFVANTKNFMNLQPKGMKVILSDFTGSGRMKYWGEAVSILKDYPVFGVGLNTYSIIGKGYKIIWGGYPHNCYLQMAVEIGIVGLLSFLWIIFVTFRNSLRGLRTMKDPFLQSTLLGALAGYCGFLAHSFFDTNFYSVQLGSLLWVTMGIIVAVQKIDNA